MLFLFIYLFFNLGNFPDLVPVKLQQTLVCENKDSSWGQEWWWTGERLLPWLGEVAWNLSWAESPFVWSPSWSSGACCAFYCISVHLLCIIADSGWLWILKKEYLEGKKISMLCACRDSSQMCWQVYRLLTVCCNTCMLRKGLYPCYCILIPS